VITGGDTPAILRYLTSEEDVDAPKLPLLFVCHGDDGGPPFHPCRRVQEALRAAGIDYEKDIAAHGSPIPFLRKGSREELRRAAGTTKLPTLLLPDGTVISHSRAILSWTDSQQPAPPH
jgi:glutathione S-transferase